jgi:hypothetical protein
MAIATVPVAVIAVGPTVRPPNHEPDRPSAFRALVSGPHERVPPDPDPPEGPLGPFDWPPRPELPSESSAEPITAIIAPSDGAGEELPGCSPCPDTIGFEDPDASLAPGAGVLLEKAGSPGVEPGSDVPSGVAPDVGVEVGSVGDVGVGVARGVGAGVGFGVGAGVGRGVGVGVGVGFGVGIGVGDGVGAGVGVAKGAGVGVGAGVWGGPDEISTVPASSVEAKWSRPVDWKTTAYEPADSVPDHWNWTPVFQVSPGGSADIACGGPSPKVTDTWPASEPSLLRYKTLAVTTVEGVPLRGVRSGLESRFGPLVAAAGRTSVSSNNAAADIAAAHDHRSRVPL